MLSKSSKAKPTEKNMQLYQKGIWLYKSQNNQELKKKKQKQNQNNSDNNK